MRIERLQPGQEVRWRCTAAHIATLQRPDEWVGTELVFRLAPAGAGRTRLDFEHAGLVPGLECHALCARGWRHFLGSLQQLVETGRGTPYESAAAAAGADLVLVTDDNPRTEDPAVIRAELLRGALAHGHTEVVEVPGRRAAISEAVRRSRPGDVIALLGKGHERGQEIAGEIHPFDDRVELVAALTERYGARS